MPKISHLSYYLILLVILASTGFGFAYYKSNGIAQTVVAFLGCLSYALWSIIHTHSEGRLRLHIALEYIAISAFAFILLFAAIQMK